MESYYEAGGQKRHLVDFSMHFTGIIEVYILFATNVLDLNSCLQKETLN